ISSNEALVFVNKAMLLLTVLSCFRTTPSACSEEECPGTPKAPKDEPFDEPGPSPSALLELSSSARTAPPEDGDKCVLPGPTRSNDLSDHGVELPAPEQSIPFDSFVFYKVPSAFTVFTLQGRILHQNPASKLYFGDHTSSHAGHPANDDASMLIRMFCLEPDKLESMQLEVLRENGGHWKGIIRVPASLASPHFHTTTESTNQNNNAISAAIPPNPTGNPPTTSQAVLDTVLELLHTTSDQQQRRKKASAGLSKAAQGQQLASGIQQQQKQKQQLLDERCNRAGEAAAAAAGSTAA
ncbi:hypothetical protein Agub_g9618, partial [Astrephomene gubernaculifera]